jgi:MSHA biogenesis protein MshQ
MQLKEYLVGGFIKKIFLYSAIGLMCSSHLYAATVRLNSGGGLNTGDGLHTYIDDTTQIQVRRLNNSGQLYNPNAIPNNAQLDNGIYLRANNTLVGPDHFGFPSTLTPTTYINRSVSTPTPATVSQGVTQSTTLQFSAPRLNTLVAGPSVTVNWKYTYPLDYITAEVTLVIPIGYSVNSSNPVRYYHAIDTYLGGSDNGCGVRYVDTNGKQVVGTYPLVSGNCPSSNSLPANLDVVESFRERNGKFDHYCVGFWNTFWTSSGSNACAIGKTASLSDTITTTYQDTGAAIEYDFTAPGVYTFSYDFVVGSTFVPNYDHFEIRHSGTGTLCPAEVKVLACLSSTVPCPDNQLVNSGILKGSLIFSPTTPTVKDSPDPFEVGSGQPIATVTMEASSAATYALGVSGLTKAPLSGVKCWNTTTNSQSCSFTFTNTPCVSTFECMENGLDYNNRVTGSARNPLYTKAIGASFDVDVVALLSTGVQSTGYNSTSGLTVELVSDNGGACGPTVIATKNVPFSTLDKGRKKVTFEASDIARPHPNLRCKVTDVSLTKTGCSSDNFAIRPRSLTVTSVSPQQLTPSPASAPVRRAGTDKFGVTVSINESTYTETPKVDSTKLETHTNVTSVGSVNGTFNPAISGVSTGSDFTYSEVGHFRFMVEGIYDDTYTKVDSENGDCDNTFESNGVGTPKRFGCKFGNTSVSSYIGRFIPDHFKVTAGTTYTDGCGTFTYYDQDPGLITPFTLEAKNSADVTTRYYTGSYATFGLTNWANYFFELATTDGSQLPNGVAINASSINPTGNWVSGIAADIQVRHRVNRPANPLAPQPYRISARPRGDDGGVSVNSTRADVFNPTDPNTPRPRFRFGRLSVTSAYGSELLPLSVPIEAQFWNGTGFARNTNDSCTTIPLTSVVMRNYRGNLNACETQLSVASPMFEGLMRMRLSAPGVTGTTPNTGSVDLKVNLGAVVSGERTCNGASESPATSGTINWFGNPEPIGRATFGVYKAPIIYMRENF